DLYWGWWDSSGDDNNSPVYRSRPFYTYSTNDKKTGTLCPTPCVFGPPVPNNFCTFNSLSSYHEGGANFLFADGHIAFLTYSVTQTAPGLKYSVLEGLITRNGGEVLNPDN